MTRAVSQDDENYNIDADRNLILHNLFKGHIAKRSPTLPLPPPGADRSRIDRLFDPVFRYSFSR